MSSLMSLVRSISRGYLDNHLNVSSGWGPLVISTGTCCSHLQRFKSDGDVIRGTFALCSSPLKLYIFLTFLSLRLPLVASSLSALLLGFPFCRQTLFFFYSSLNSVVWMWLLLYRKRHFLTERFQTLNLCREELQSLLSRRFEVQDSRLHQCWRISWCPPTDEECPRCSAVTDCNWPRTLGQVTTAERWTSRTTEMSKCFFLGFCFRLLMLALCYEHFEKFIILLTTLPKSKNIFLKTNSIS